MQPKISIVVPIYNVEKYLVRCVESLLKQSYTNIEILLVDDGSPDASGSICDEYAQKDSRIISLHKENGGLSDARNYGQAHATGDYILCVDSDDCITDDAVQKLVEVLEKCGDVDIVVGGAPFIIVEDDVNKDKIIAATKTEAPISEFSVTSGEEYIKNAVAANEYRVPVWLKLYNRSFLTENKLIFGKGLLHEDELYTPAVFLKAKKVAVSKIRFYLYFIREGSIMTGKNQLRNALSVLEIAKRLEETFAAVGDKELQSILRDHMATIHYQALARITKAEAVENGVLDYGLLKKNSISFKNKLRLSLVGICYDLFKKITRVR